MRKRIRQAALLQGAAPLRAWTVLFDVDSLSPVGTRADLARGMVAEVAIGDAKVRNDFDGVPIFKRPIFNATWDEAERRFVDFVERGEEDFTLSPTEKGREVVYRCTPFWYQLELSEAGRIRRVSVSDRALEGYTLAPMFRDGKTPVYRPSFEAAIDYSDRKLHSRAGLVPCEANPDVLRSYMESLGGHARPEKGADWFSDYLLLLVEFATCNLQGVMHGVRDGEVSLFNASSSHADCPVGLYSVTEPPFVKGDRVSLLADGGNGEFMTHGEYTVKEVILHEGIGYRIVFESLDLELLFWETVAWKCATPKVKTGAALSAVTRASSGAASASSVAPIVWRGKENPWGNVPTVIADYAFARKRDGRGQLLRANTDRLFAFRFSESYLPCGEVYRTFEGEDSFVKGVALTERGDFLYPVAFDDEAADCYFATRVSLYSPAAEDEDIWCAIAMGGGRGNPIATNFATMDMISQMAADGRWETLGCRLIFEEG